MHSFVSAAARTIQCRANTQLHQSCSGRLFHSAVAAFLLAVGANRIGARDLYVQGKARAETLQIIERLVFKAQLKLCVHGLFVMVIYFHEILWYRKKNQTTILNSHL